jgi:hypothetical protein
MAPGGDGACSPGGAAKRSTEMWWVHGRVAHRPDVRSSSRSARAAQSITGSCQLVEQPGLGRRVLELEGRGVRGSRTIVRSGEGAGDPTVGFPATPGGGRSSQQWTRAR